MQAGDIVKLTSWLGQNVTLLPSVDPPTTLDDIELLPGTIALILEVLNSNEDDGPSMDTYVHVLVNGKTGYVRAYTCEEIK